MTQENQKPQGNAKRGRVVLSVFLAIYFVLLLLPSFLGTGEISLWQIFAALVFSNLLYKGVGLAVLLVGFIFALNLALSIMTIANLGEAATPLQIGEVVFHFVHALAFMCFLVWSKDYRSYVSEKQADHRV